MMRIRLLITTLLVCTATSAVAQQRPIFDPEDFVDPRERTGPLFISRAVAGVAKGFVNDARPLHEDAAFLHIANSFYWRDWQFDYKHSEVRTEHGGGTVDVQRCGCTPPVYFPTPPPHDATPAAPPAGSRETLQAGWYHSYGNGSAEPPIMLRYRLTWSRQPIGTDIHSVATGQFLGHRSGHEQSIGFDADTHLRLRGRDLYGALWYGRTTSSGTIDDRTQQTFAYMARFPAASIRSWLLLPTFTAGAITGRGATGLNLVNPSIEAYWHADRLDANVHVIWSPIATRSGAEGWQRHSQLAVYVDRALYVKFFR